jgi:integrase
MSRTKVETTGEFIARYNPAIGRYAFIEPEQWSTVGDVVRESVKPLAHLVSPTVRPFLTAMTRYAQWASRRGYDLNVAVLLSPEMVASYLANVKRGAIDEEPLLWRLSKSWGLTDAHALVRDGLRRPDYKRPYTDDELDSLVEAARSQPTTLRKATLLGVIFLGAGCGVTRQAAANARVGDLHAHGDAHFWRTEKYCAYVRPEFVVLYDEVVTLRPKGLLRGNAQANSLWRAKNWIGKHRGTPAFSTDRLRATYVCALLRAPVSLADVMSWTGLANADALNGYLAYTRPVSVPCDLVPRVSR